MLSVAVFALLITTAIPIISTMVGNAQYNQSLSTAKTVESVLKGAYTSALANTDQGSELTSTIQEVLQDANLTVDMGKNKMFWNKTTKTIVVAENSPDENCVEITDASMDTLLSLF